MINDITVYIEDYFIIHKYSHHDIIKALELLKLYCDKSITEINMEINGEL